MDDGAMSLNLELTRLETLEAESGEARNLGSWEQRENMKIEMKKETRWDESRILDCCIND